MQRSIQPFERTSQLICHGAPFSARPPARRASPGQAEFQTETSRHETYSESKRTFHRSASICHATPFNVKASSSFVTDIEMPETEVDPNGTTRIKFKPQGWYYWSWRGHKIHYIKAGSQEKPPILLVHGFGASAYHWRYVIPELAKQYCVHAVDLLGFGFSSKPSIVYNGYRIWSEQLRDYVTQMLGGRKSVFVGNSMGAYASLLTSATFPDVSRGLVLVNGAGRFDEVKAAVEAAAETVLDQETLKSTVQEVATEGNAPSTSGRNSMQSSSGSPSTSRSNNSQSGSFFGNIFDPLQTLAKRAGIYIAFLAAKQPSRIKQVLRQVYVSQKNIDDDLVQSIVIPAQDSNAPDVFYRVISSSGAGASINSLLPKLEAPVFLLWGELDPWITPASADKIQKLLPSVERHDVKGGHCPHDDVPELFIPPLQQWLQKLT